MIKKTRFLLHLNSNQRLFLIICCLAFTSISSYLKMAKFNVDDREAKFMGNLASVWWDKDGVWKSLHDFSEIRVQFVVASLISRGKLQPNRLNAKNALKGIKILEIG